MKRKPFPLFCFEGRRDLRGKTRISRKGRPARPRRDFGGPFGDLPPRGPRCPESLCAANGDARDNGPFGRSTAISIRLARARARPAIARWKVVDGSIGRVRAGHSGRAVETGQKHVGVCAQTFTKLQFNFKIEGGRARRPLGRRTVGAGRVFEKLKGAPARARSGRAGAKALRPARRRRTGRNVYKGQAGRPPARAAVCSRFRKGGGRRDVSCGMTYTRAVQLPRGAQAIGCAAGV